MKKIDFKFSLIFDPVFHPVIRCICIVETTAPHKFAVTSPSFRRSLPHSGRHQPHFEMVLHHPTHTWDPCTPLSSFQIFIANHTFHICFKNSNPWAWNRLTYIQICRTTHETSTLGELIIIKLPPFTFPTIILSL